MTLTHSIQQTFIKHRWCGMLSALPSPLARPTHTLSMSMRLLCRRFPSWSSRAFSSLICSASSGFKSNSAGNAEIQYLLEASSHPRQPFPHRPRRLELPREGERAPNCGSPTSRLIPSPPPLGRSENPGPDQPARGKPAAAHPPWTEPGLNPHDQCPFPLLQARLKPERREQEEGTKPQQLDSPDQVARFHLQRIGVVLPGLLVGEGELRKSGMETNSRKGGRGRVPSSAGRRKARPGPRRNAGGGIWGGAGRKGAEGGGEG